MQNADASLGFRPLVRFGINLDHTWDCPDPGEVDKAPRHRNIRDIHRPDLVRSRDLNLTLANFRTGKCTKCPRIRGARGYLIGPGRAQNLRKFSETSEMPAKWPFPGPENWPKSS